MVKTWSVDPTEIGQLLEGLAVLGNGGGGSPDWGKQILENDLRRRRIRGAVMKTNSKTSSTEMGGC